MILILVGLVIFKFYVRMCGYCVNCLIDFPINVKKCVERFAIKTRRHESGAQSKGIVRSGY